MINKQQVSSKAGMFRSKPRKLSLYFFTGWHYQSSGWQTWVLAWQEPIWCDCSLRMPNLVKRKPRFS